MRVKMSLEDVLEGKVKGGVLTADDSITMREAVKLMANNNFGALVLTSKGEPSGIITERDVLRLAAEHGEEFFDLPVSESMTRDIVVGRYRDDVEVAKAIMTEKRFRHMPIMHKGELVGMLSLGDVVRSQLTTAQAEAIYLRDYIRGEYT
ncbi:MAG: CBS domain-containing protein [Myxococcota bacterium]